MKLYRALLSIIFVVVSAYLYRAWQMVSRSVPMPSATPMELAMRVEAPSIPEHELLSDMVPQERYLTLETQDLRLRIDQRGGILVGAELLQYPATSGSNEYVRLLADVPEKDFICRAQYGVLSSDGLGRDYPPEYAVLRSPSKDMPERLDKGLQSISLFFKTKNGLFIQKTFEVQEKGYQVKVKYRFLNESDKPIAIRPFSQLEQSLHMTPELKKSLGLNGIGYQGVAYSTDQINYRKSSFQNLAKQPLNRSSQGGWIALLHPYFATAWVPLSEEKIVLYSNVDAQKQLLQAGYATEERILQPGEAHATSATLWIGPQLQEEMAALASHLDLTVDYGWLWFLSQPLFRLLKALHGLLGNWGNAIIAITFIVRGLMYPLTRAQVRAMQKMKALQPKLALVQERCAHDKQLLSREIMALYQAEKVNPLSGCFPLLLQMPIFLALYWMLMASVELRQAPFCGWIQDLSAPDPYYILPCVLGGTLYLLQRLAPSSPLADPMQKRLMQWMPLLFVGFFIRLPSGLVLYYVVSNLVTLLQQHFLFRQQTDVHDDYSK